MGDQVVDPQVDVEAVASQWTRWALGTLRQARALDPFDPFDASLKRCRATTYQRAVELLKANPDPRQAAKQMIGYAVDAHVRTPPLIGFDQAAVRYTTARTWQRCALMLDPSLDEVQPLWS